MKKSSKKPIIITAIVIIILAAAGFGYYTWKQAEQRRKATEFHQNIQKNLKDKGLPAIERPFDKR